MKKMLRTLVGVSALSLLAAAPGCVDSNAALFIGGVLPVTAPACTAASGVGLYQGSGVLDIGAAGNDGNAYIGAVEIRVEPSVLTAQVGRGEPVGVIVAPECQAATVYETRLP